MTRPQLRHSIVSIEAERKFRARAKVLGGRVVEPEWLGANTPHRCICPEGHECAPRPGSIQQGAGMCDTCANKNRNAKRRDATAKRFRVRVETQGGQVIEPEWHGVDFPHRVICANGHHGTARPHYVLAGGGICKACAGMDPVEYERLFRARLAERGATLVEPKWLGATVPHRCICVEGHEYTPKPHEVMRGHAPCGACAGIDPAANFARFCARVDELGGRVLETEWLGHKTPHRVICAAGHSGTARPTYVLNKGGSICAVCSGKDTDAAREAFYARVVELGGTVVDTEWKGATRKHHCICPKGHDCYPYPGNLRGGGGLCGECVGLTPEGPWVKFRRNVERQGGRVIEREWRGVKVLHRVQCSNGHVVSVAPNCVNSGQGICRFCAGMWWDAFYVVRNPSTHRVKLGISSNDTRNRLSKHRSDGYTQTLLTIDRLPGADQCERFVLRRLQRDGIEPVRGREYFDESALPLILSYVEQWTAARDRARD